MNLISMDYVIKPHARQRLKERRIPESLVRGAINDPTKIGYDARDRLMFKKLYRHKGKVRLLLVVGEIVDGILEVITVVDTSKIKKYL